MQKNPHIGKLAVLQKKPDRDNALLLLKEIAHRVSYLMKEEKLKIKQLVEFYPKDKRLLGMNVNYGSKVMLRLRDPDNEVRFLSKESILSTILHELTHNLYGPHDKKFYRKLNELTSKNWVIEQQGLYDSFIGKGRVLGFKDQQKPLFINFRLGGKINRIKNLSPKKMAAMAAEKRALDANLCGYSNKASVILPDDNDLEFIIINDDLELNNLNPESTILSTHNILIKPQKKRNKPKHTEIINLSEENETVEYIDLT